MKENTYEKLDLLRRELENMGSAAIGFSGGVDSTFLSAVAYSVLGEKAVTFTAVSSSFPEREREESIRLAGHIGIQQVFFESEEVDIHEFRDNPVNRCYYCKRELYARLKDLAEKRGIHHVIDASNADDAGDHRPGLLALTELAVRSPLKEVGLTKREIRELSNEMGLPTWDKPAFACLSSRFQYGQSITHEKLKRVEQAEDFLKDLGIRVLRARDHGDQVRLEVGPDEIDKFFDAGFRHRVVKALKEIGYTFVSLDLEGYRSGSMNEVIDALHSTTR